MNQDIKNRYDLIITKRTLINLGNFENQKRVIQKIYNSLNENGYYVMLECSKDGLDNMNEIRKIFLLDEIPMPFHNLHFSLKMLSEFLEDYFEIVTKTYFSDYFFLTRIVAPYIDKKEPYKFDNAFKDLSSLNLIKKNVSPQFLMLLRKK